MTKLRKKFSLVSFFGLCVIFYAVLALILLALHFCQIPIPVKFLQSEPASGFLYVSAFLFSLYYLVCGWGIWKKRRWGIYGYFAIAAAGMIGSYFYFREIRLNLNPILLLIFLGLENEKEHLVHRPAAHLEAPEIKNLFLKSLDSRQEAE